MKIKAFFLLLGAVIIFNACDESATSGGGCVEGNGNIETVIPEVETFSEIVVLGSANVKFNYAEDHYLAITTDENLQKYIRVISNPPILTIRQTDDVSVCPTEFSIEVTTPTPEAVRLKGSGIISNDKPVNSDEFTSSIDGSGDIMLSGMETEVADLHILGSGNIQYNGSAGYIAGIINGSGNFEYIGETEKNVSKIFGSGNIYGLDMKAKSAVYEVVGSGNISAYATDSLTATILGSGNIFYKGNPAYTNFRIAGTGNVEKLD